jgi:hypothetical protein
MYVKPKSNCCGVRGLEMCENIYNRIEAEKYRCRQNSDGTWICSDLKANTIQELDIAIGMVNKVLNKYNKSVENKKK